MQANLEKVARTNDSHCRKWDEERQKRAKLQYEPTTMRQENEELQGKDDNAIVEAFKSSKRFEESQIDFAHPIFEIGKLHVCRVAAAFGVKLGDLVKYAAEDHYTELALHSHLLVI